MSRVPDDDWIAYYEDTRTMANNYVYAVERQISRIRELPSADESFVMRQFVDVEFLLVALTRLRRAVCALQKIPAAAEKAKLAIAQFDQRVPHVKDLRDITEHYDDYLARNGRNRRMSADRVRRGLLTKEMTQEQTQWMGYTIYFDECMEAALELFENIKIMRSLLNRV